MVFEKVEIDGVDHTEEYGLGIVRRFRLSVNKSMVEFINNESEPKTLSSGLRSNQSVPANR